MMSMLRFGCPRVRAEQSFSWIQWGVWSKLPNAFTRQA